MKNQRAVTYSIRIDRDVYEVLKDEASLKSVSSNNLVNQILRKYVEFDRYAPKFEFLLFHKNLVLQGLEGLSDDVVISAGSKSGSAFTRDAINTMGLPLNKRSFFYFIETVLGKYKNFYDCQRQKADGRERFYLRHQLGRKWSLFLKGYITSAFETITHEKIDVEITDASVSFLA